MIHGTLTQQQAKDLARLHRRRHREEEGMLLLEGERLIRDLFPADDAAGHSTPAHGRPPRPVQLIVDQAKAERYAGIIERAAAAGVEVLLGSSRNTAKLTDTDHPQGIYALLPLPGTDAAEAVRRHAGAGPLFVLDGVSDPGNLGTIMRSTAWFGGRSLLLSSSSVDPFNSKVVRASMGTALQLQVGVYENADELFALADGAGLELVATSAAEGVAPRDFTGADHAMILLGSEAHGLDDSLLARIPRRLRIPGQGTESLNLAMAHAVLAYEFSN